MKKKKLLAALTAILSLGIARFTMQGATLNSVAEIQNGAKVTSVGNVVVPIINLTVNFQNKMLVKSNSRVGEITISNAKSNQNNAYVTIFINNKTEKICETGIIPVGGELNNVYLSKTLANGTYKGNMIYNLINDDNEVVQQVDLGITIQVGA